jgi:sugar phosphate isomerase/epimerase
MQMIHQSAKSALDHRFKETREMTTTDTPPTLRWGHRIRGGDFDPENPERHFEKLACAGYDFVEISCPESRAQADLWRRAAEGAGLGVVVQIHSIGKKAVMHACSLTGQLQRAAWMSPEVVNSHTGSDLFPATENAFIFHCAISEANDLGIALVHETHCSRALFSAPSTRELLSRLPSLRLCADFSHWCSIHDSFLTNQSDSVSAALARADYLHLRIGHTQSPQITDLDNLEWHEAIAVHIEWWRQNIESLPNGKTLRVAPEFSPFPDRHVQCKPDELWAIKKSMRALFLARLPIPARSESRAAVD